MGEGRFRNFALSPILARDKYSVHSVVALVALFLFLISFAMIAFARISEDRRIYDQQIRYIIDDIHLLAVSLDVLDYQTVTHLAEDILEHDLVEGLKVEDKYAYVLYNEMSEQADGDGMSVQQVNIGENRDLVESPPGIATVVYRPYRIALSLPKILILSAALSLTVIVPVAFVLIMALNRYIGTPLQHLNNAIRKCIEEGNFTRVDYSSDTAFGEFALRFNQMQERLESEVTKSELLSEKNREGRLRAESIAAELRDERDQRNAEAQLMGDLLSANHQLAVYRTTDGAIRTNVSRFPDLKQPAILNFLAEPCFERASFEQRMTSLTNQVAKLEFIREKIDGDSKHMTYVIETTDSHFWNAELISIKSHLDAVVFTDRTEVYLAERTKSQDDKLRALGQLTSGVAHDFNNILGIISLATQSLKSSVDDSSAASEQWLEDLEIIENGSARAAGIVSHLLAFSREKQMKKEYIDLSEFFTSTRAVLKAILQANIELELDIEEGLAINANKDQFQTCVMNFATNSRHAMPEGGKFTIRCHRRNTSNLANLNDNQFGYVAVEFIDNGQGMDKEVIARIFEPFFTTKSPGNGTGLGLSMAYGFASDLNGSLTCRSMPGEGTTFLLVLPLVEEQAQSNPAPKKEAPKAGQALSGINLVLVDDENVLRHITKRGLESLGATVVDFPSLAEFSDGIGEVISDIDMVISDNMLEDGSSADIWASLREWDADTPMIVITGNETPKLSEMIANGDIAKLVDKPFSMQHLSKEVKSVLSYQRQAHG